jgi:hypothetical protein
VDRLSKLAELKLLKDGAAGEVIKEVIKRRYKSGFRHLPKAVVTDRGGNVQETSCSSIR